MAFTARTPENTEETTANITVNKPSGTTEGDIMFALITPNGYSVKTLPGGWTELASMTPRTDKYWLYYKVAGASEPSSYSWEIWNSCIVAATIVTYTSGDFDGADPIDTHSNTAYIVDNAILRAASITVSATNSPIVFIGGLYSVASKTVTPPTNPDTFTEDCDIKTNRWVAYFASLVWDSSGATGLIDGTISGNEAEKHAFAVALNPSGGAITLDLRSSTDTAARAVLDTGVDLSLRTLSGSAARLTISVAVFVAGKVTVGTRAALEITVTAATELALRTSTGTRADLVLNTAVLLAIRAIAGTSARLALTALISAQLRSSTATRAALTLTISLATELACRSATATRAAIGLDSLITLALLSQTSTRAALDIRTEVRHQEVDVTLHSRQLTTALPGRSLTMAKHGIQQ